MISTIFKIIGLVLFAIVVVAFVVFFGMWFLAAFAAMTVLFGVAWLVGVPITIKSNGEKIGYLRWTKFHRAPGK